MVTTVQENGRGRNANIRGRRRRRNRAVKTATTVTNRVLSVQGPAMQQTNRVRRRIRGRPGLSEAGMSFLKCAFASPDFSVDPGKGIPDCYNGRTLSIKDCYTTTINFTADNDTYIVVAPVPGYAYFSQSLAIGGQPTSLTGVPFPSYTTNFGDSNSAAMTATYESSNNQFSAFRYASLAVGIYPTSNYMQFSGSISIWKADLNLGTNIAQVNTTGTPATVQALYYNLMGLESATTLVPRDSYNESFIKGGYCIATDMTGEFEWNDFKYSNGYLTTADTSSTSFRQLAPSSTSTALTGLGNVQSIIIKVSSSANAVNSAMIRIWNCVELKPRTDSSLFQFSGVSPDHDPLALEMYAHVKNRIPVAVPASENPLSWERVLKIIQDIS